MTPRIYSLLVTHKCHFNCSVCSNCNKQKDVSMTKWKEIIDKISNHAKIIKITGGEPILNPELQQIVEYIDKFNIVHSLLTTASFTTKKIIDVIKIYSHLTQPENFAGILISLHGINEKQHNKFTKANKTSFERTINAIKMLSNTGFDVVTNTVVTRFNIDYIQEIIDFSNSLGAKYCVFNRLHSTNLDLYPEMDKFRNVIKFINQQNYDINARFGNSIPHCFHSNNTKQNYGFEHCYIMPNGDVKPSDLSKTVFGNVLNDRINQIWNSQQAVYYRNKLPVICKRCKKIDKCGGSEISYIVDHNLKYDLLIDM